MTLAEFLRARLDEDEQAARDLGGSCWLDVDDDATGEAVQHFANEDRVRVEVEAKRRIVELVAEEDAAGSGLTDADGLARSLRAIAVLHLLALPYAEHPDYDPSWRP